MLRKQGISLISLYLRKFIKIEERLVLKPSLSPLGLEFK
jgi:hypothetical protein